ncbi:oligosaccharide flippase family protein [Spongiivirga citrea]|uniref:Oligosaccharide flippase family protein n=1 Tax=Spongiivirga citrea TaxID=1481457 RepID=A0A6M0CSW3_9FLAO|nr:oligosaccharide flippase family protein [Spongiivirga citrea]NER19009.1 oligosaccharide flippase family protein [Spongiivirga citrea]
MSALKRFFKDTAIYGITTVLARFISFILVPLHTAAMGTVDYSGVTEFFVYAAFLNVLLSYGMETAFFRFFNTHKEKDTVYTTALISLTVSTILFFIGVWIFKDQLADLIKVDRYYFKILVGITALDALVVAPFAYLRAKNRPIRFAGVKLTNIAIVGFVNLFFLWIIPEFSLEFSFYNKEELLQYVFWANLSASAVTLILLFPLFFKLKLVFDTGLFRKLLSYGWPILVAGLAFVINENLDKLMLQEMIDEDTMGAYAGCYKIAVFMTIFIQGFRLGAEPFFFSHAKSDNAVENYATILKYFVIAGGLGLLIICCFIDPLKNFIVRDTAYHKAIDIVPIVLLANLCLGIYHNLSIWYKLTDKTRYGMYISIIGAIITIAFNWIMIPKIGFIASAWATLAAYGGMMIISYQLGKKHYPVPYDLKKIGFYLALAIGLSAVSFIQFRENYWLASAFVLVFLGAVFLIEKKELKSILN